MTYEEITNPTKYVRVIASTYTTTTNLEPKEMIGGEFEVREENYYDKTISVWNKDKSYWLWFNRSDVQFLTPVEFNGRKIAIGDEVMWNNIWRKVYGYRWYDGKWVVETVKNNDFEYGCFSLYVNQIKDHRTPQSHSQEDIEKAKQLLIEAGVLVDGKVLKQ